MKNLLLISTLLFTVMFSSTSFSGLTKDDEDYDIKWTKVEEDVKGNNFYVDYGSIRKDERFVYYWVLSDYIESSKSGIFSNKSYKQGVCNLSKYKSLRYFFHKEPMGRGDSIIDNDPDKDWTNTSPNSVEETILKSVCSSSV